MHELTCWKMRGCDNRRGFRKGHFDGESTSILIKSAEMFQLPLHVKFVAMQT